MTRTHRILLALLVVQVLLVVAVRAPWRETGGSVRRPLVPELADQTVTKLTIEGPADDSVVLERAGEGYALPELGGYPVDGARIDELLAALKGLAVRAPVVSRAKHHETLRVAEDAFERRVTLETSGGAKAVLYVGTSPQYQVQNVRREGEDDVFEVRGLSTWQVRADAQSWVARQVLEIPVERARRVTIANAQGSFVFEKVGDSWRGPADMDGEASAELVRALATVWATRAIGARDDAAQGFATPAARVTFEVAGNAESDPVTTTTLLVGAPVEGGEGERYVSREDWGFAAAVSEAAVLKALTFSGAPLEPPAPRP